MDEWAVGVLCKRCIPTSYLYVVCDFNFYLYSVPTRTVFWCYLYLYCVTSVSSTCFSEAFALRCFNDCFSEETIRIG